MPAWAPADSWGEIRHPSSDGDWSKLLEDYGQHVESPMGRVVEVARAHRTLTVVEEFRYVDPDYRSEYSAFWSKRFLDRPPFARRLHFFRKKFDLDALLSTRGDLGYVGYSTMRPVSPGRVGRTMLAPPRRLKDAVLTLTTDRLSLFGRPLEVTGVPFCEQDAEYLRCAHAAVWVCHYHAHRQGLVGRRLTSELVDLSPTSLTQHRSLPSQGLNVNQLQAIFASTGQPAQFYGISKLPDVEGVADPVPENYPGTTALKVAGYWDTRMHGVICRYLNAGFPVLVGTHNHAFVIVGWYRSKDQVHFVACDDQWGPYESISSPFTDRRAPWTELMIPLPPKVFLSAEVAQSKGYIDFRGWASQDEAPLEWTQIGNGLVNGDVSLRTFLKSNHAYKSAVGGQKRGAEAEEILRLARLPHFVWVVEAHDKRAREKGKPCVLAEIVIDSTSSDHRPEVLALSLPGVTLAFDPGQPRPKVNTSTPQAWASQLVCH